MIRDGTLTKRPIYLIRFLNAGGFGSLFGPLLLTILHYLKVQPALRKSLTLMQQADKEDVVPKILCDEQARRDMSERLEEHYNDLKATTTLTTFAKVLNYFKAYICLTNHYGLLQLGMNPKVQEEIIKEPVFIASLPRTGTTMLHKAMALDKSRFCNFDLCDGLLPLPQPIPRWDKVNRAKKAKEAMSKFEELGTIYPGWLGCLATMHGVTSDEADEDIHWYDAGLGHPWIEPCVKMHSLQRSKPGGRSKMETTKVAKYRYAWLAMVMKLYQHADKVEWNDQHDGPCPTETLPWLMKDPNHSCYVTELVETFPDAKLIFIHRPPGEIVASLAKLLLVLTSIEQVPGAPGTSAMEWGVETKLRIQQNVDGYVNFTKSKQGNDPYAYQTAETQETTLEPKRRLDFMFEDFITDIPRAIETIYRQFYPTQPPPSKEAMTSFRNFLDANTRTKCGNQRRSLEDFGLTPEHVTYPEYSKHILQTYLPN